MSNTNIYYLRFSSDQPPRVYRNPGNGLLKVIRFSNFEYSQEQKRILLAHMKQIIESPDSVEKIKDIAKKALHEVSHLPRIINPMPERHNVRP